MVSFFVLWKQSRTEWYERSLICIGIGPDTDQYQRIYCNICVRVARAHTDVFDRLHRLVRSEALQHGCFGTRLTVSTCDKIECEMLLVLLRL